MKATVKCRARDKLWYGIIKFHGNACAWIFYCAISEGFSAVQYKNYRLYSTFTLVHFTKIPCVHSMTFLSVYHNQRKHVLRFIILTEWYLRFILVWISKSRRFLDQMEYLIKAQINKISKYPTNKQYVGVLSSNW